MTALNDKALSQYKWDLFIRTAGSNDTPIDLWAIRGLAGNIDNTNITEIMSDNRWTLLKFVDLQSTITVTLLEVQSRDLLDLLFNTTSSNVAWSATPVTLEAVGTTVPAWFIYTLANRNGNKTQVDSISLADTGWALILNTDYTVWVNEDWETYIVFLTATTGATTVNYTYTPNTSENTEITVWTNLLKNFELQIIAYEGTKARKITLSSATLNATYGIWFTDIIENGDVIGAEVTFEANKGSTFKFENEIL